VFLGLLLVLPLKLVTHVPSDQKLSQGRVKRENRPNRQSPLGFERIMLRILGPFYRLVIVPLVAFLPASLAYRVACLQGDLRYRLDRSKREEIMRCLESVFGDRLSLPEQTRVTRDFFRLQSCAPVDVTRLAGKGRALTRLVEIRGREHLEAALAAGKGAILCSAHFGSFNCAMSLIGASGFPITVIGRWASNTAIFLPTGTLANDLAVRRLAQSGRRILVQQESHLWNDEGDCAQHLSGLTVIPLASMSAGRASPRSARSLRLVVCAQTNSGPGKPRRAIASGEMPAPMRGTV